jgi:hypothetical protein
VSATIVGEPAELLTGVEAARHPNSAASAATRANLEDVNPDTVILPLMRGETEFK